MESQFRLGEWVIFPKINSVASNGRTVHLEPKVMQVLACLAESGDIVSKEALMRTVWADTFVTDDVLTRSISELRKVFCDDPKNPQYIQTIPKSGYRLLIKAEPVEGQEAIHKTNSFGEPATTFADSASAGLRPRRRIVLAWAVVGLAIIATLLFYLRSQEKSEGPSAFSGRNMLAVLPFQNLNNDAEHDYYADGLTAEMISQLGRLPSERLGVIAWNSMIRYKGTRKSEEEIAQELGANYVLEGTVRRSGGQIRITAELVHVGDRSHVWANSYDGNLEDVLALQNRVAREIASEIRVQLTPEQEAQLGNPGPVNPEGYTLYLQSKFSPSRGTANGLREMAERFQKAVELNANYAPPYVAMAVAYRQLASEGFAPSSTYAKAQDALKKALQIDPTLSEAHQEMGWVKWRWNWDFAAADAQFRRAIELSPGGAQSHAEYSLFLKSMGRFADALREVNASIALNPMDAYSQANAGHLLGLMQRYDEATEHFRRALELAPNQAYVHERFGAVLLWAGRTEQAISEFEKAGELSDSEPEKLAWMAYAYGRAGRKADALSLLSRTQRSARENAQYFSPFHIALAYAGIGDTDNALRWLEEAYSQHDEWLVYLRVYPEFQNLRTESRFTALEGRIGSTR